MDQDKLITEICNLANSYCYDDGTFDYNLFEESLRKIMPPTCGVEQRKFLDELGKMYMDKHMILHKGATLIDQGDFGADLLKVVKGG
jgi:hypothetical protein